MSSDEDEFYDAPNAFLSSTFSSKWSDSNEDLNLTALENESKNAERRNRVETLRRSGMSCGNNTLVQYENFNENKDDITYQSHFASLENESIQIPTTSAENEQLSSHSIIQTVIFQQQLLQKLQDNPNLCQCMKNLLNTVITPNSADNIGKSIVKPDNKKQTNSTMTQSCPECCKPIYSLGTTLGLSNAYNNTKSWSLDSAKVLEIEKRLLNRNDNKEYRYTFPTQQTCQPNSHLEPLLLPSVPMEPFDVPGQIALNCSTCQQCPTQNEYTKTLHPDSTYQRNFQMHHLQDPKTNTATICVCNKNKSSLNQTLDNFSRHDSLKASKTLKESMTTSFYDPKVTMNSKTLTGPVSNEIPPEMNPIEIQFRERTKSTTSLQRSEDSVRLQDKSDFSQRAIFNIGGKVKKFQKNVKNALTAVSRAKIFNQDEESSSEDEEFVGNRGIRLRSSRRMKGRRDFLQIKLVQEMKDEHTGAIWAMRFSPCGKLLATAGYDRAIRVWVLRQYYWYFKQYQRTAGTADATNSNSDKIDFDMNKQPMMNEDEIGIDSVSLASTSISTGKTDGCGSTCSSGDDDIEQGRRTPFRCRPLIVYRGHEGVITDLVWSKNLFLLVTSMDRQVRLWHISRRECLCIFNHNDTVPTVVFHPKDDRYFLSGSLDGKLRLWNIPDKKIRYWVEALLPNSLPAASLFSPLKSSSNSLLPPKTVITCAVFVCEATKVAVGTYDGRILFYTAELEYITSMAIKSSHRKNKYCRVTAIEVDPTDSCKILVTTNDSRVRLIDARDYHIICKYRGFVNTSSRIRASFSPTGKYIISGSENSSFYIWKKDVEVNKMTRFSTTRKDRNNYWEAIKAHETVVSVSGFSPAPHLVLDKRFRRRHSINMSTHPYSLDQHSNIGKPDNYLGEVIVSADINGVIRVFKNRLHSHPVSAKPNQ